MDADDLAFLENIEQSAPKEEVNDGGYRCTECNEILEQTEDAFVCPNCGTQAANILVTEESEIYLDTGHGLQLHRVDMTAKRPKHSIDYGWAWSTDEIIVDILVKQIKKLENIKLVDPTFKKCVESFWFKYWTKFVAPFIQDSYKESDLIPLNAYKSLKYRDIDVLIKMQDRVMIPKKITRNYDLRYYTHLGTKFYTTNPEHPRNQMFKQDSSIIKEPSCDIIVEPSEEELNLTRNISQDSITVLTLSRTLAFLEACCRLLNLDIFASDLIRLVNHRVIPFYGAHQSLPEHVKLNHKDRLMFQKTRSPTPHQLSRSACTLIYKVYEEKLPITIPAPNLEKILEKFLFDLNLPLILAKRIIKEIDFESISQTRNTVLRNRRQNMINYPQYNRWAFAILVSYLLRNIPIFDKELKSLSKSIRRDNQDKYVWDPKLWFEQLSIKLELITAHDPFTLLHPMIDSSKLETSSSLISFMNQIINDQPVATTKTKFSHEMFEDSFREELSNFLNENLPRPQGISKSPKTDKLETCFDFHHPITDALYRTFKYNKNSDRCDIIKLNFKEYRLISMKASDWSLIESNKIVNHQTWPKKFKLLLSAGAYVCYCHPHELLNELRFVELYKSSRNTMIS